MSPRVLLPLGLALAGCGGPPCPTPFEACADVHEPCGGIDGERCARGLDCVPSVPNCTIGPCPGACEWPCTGPQDCGADEVCAAPDGADPDGRRWCRWADPPAGGSPRRAGSG